jgi:phage shock protein A
MKKTTHEEKEGLEELIDFHKKEKDELREEKQKLEFEYGVLKRKVEDLEEHYSTIKIIIFQKN